MPLPEFTGALGVKRAAHLLRRATFGATKQQIDTFATYTPVQAITQLFRQALPDPVLPVDPETGSEWFLSGVIPDVSSESFDLQNYFKKWVVGQMLSSGIAPAQSLAYSAREKIIFFLHTHFTAISEKIGSSRALYFQNQLFRLYALDALNPDPLVNIKELTKKISVDNGMIRLLDGNQNVKGSVNENYARELLELYSIGRGLEGTLPPATEQGDYIVYKEQDVQEAAKVLSGWEFDLDRDVPYASLVSIDPDTLLPRGKVRGNSLNASGHDNDPKIFSNRFGNAVIQPDPALLNAGNATEASALDEISQLIELIFAQTETPRNICRKIYRFFVYHEINATVNSSIITEMVNTLISNGHKIQPVIENLLRSQHFYEANAGVDDDNFGAIIKSPLDLMNGYIRFFNIPVPTMASPTAFYDFTSDLLLLSGRMGMSFYQPFDVAGYDAYHQFPIYNRSWISVNYLTNRYDFIRQNISSSLMGPYAFDPIAFIEANFTNVIASNARSLVSELAKYLLPVQDNLTFDTAADDNSGLTAERLNYFLVTFLSDIDPPGTEESEWTNRWTNKIGMDTVRGQLENLFNAMLQSPEYQLM